MSFSLTCYIVNLLSFLRVTVSSGASRQERLKSPCTWECARWSRNVITRSSFVATSTKSACGTSRFEFRLWIAREWPRGLRHAVRHPAFESLGRHETLYLTLSDARTRRSRAGVDEPNVSRQILTVVSVTSRSQDRSPASFIDQTYPGTSRFALSRNTTAGKSIRIFTVGSYYAYIVRIISTLIHTRARTHTHSIYIYGHCAYLQRYSHVALSLLCSSYEAVSSTLPRKVKELLTICQTQ